MTADVKTKRYLIIQLGDNSPAMTSIGMCHKYIQQVLRPM